MFEMTYYQKWDIYFDVFGGCIFDSGYSYTVI